MYGPRPAPQSSRHHRPEKRRYNQTWLHVFWQECSLATMYAPEPRLNLPDTFELSERIRKSTRPNDGLVFHMRSVAVRVSIAPARACQWIAWRIDGGGENASSRFDRLATARGMSSKKMARRRHD